MMGVNLSFLCEHLNFTLHGWWKDKEIVTVHEVLVSSTFVHQDSTEMAMTGTVTTTMVSTATALTERVTTSGATTERGWTSRVTETWISVGTVSMKKVGCVTFLRKTLQRVGVDVCNVSMHTCVGVHVCMMHSKHHQRRTIKCWQFLTS